VRGVKERAWKWSGCLRRREASYSSAQRPPWAGATSGRWLASWTWQTGSFSSGTGSLRATNGSAPDADTTFEIGSITKTFTASALAHAVVTGRLSLDTPVRDILPAGTSVPVRDAVEITVEHLARHTSGLPRSPQRLGPRAIWAAGARGEDPYAPINTPVLLDN
jgi:CubicO group peptidase (beta-lactamase class C family)